MDIVNIENISALEQKTMVTVGMFDGVHMGHRHLLAALLEGAATMGLHPVVVTFDKHPRLVVRNTRGDDKPVGLLTTLEERMAALASCGVPTVVMVHFTEALASLTACQFTRQYLLRQLNMRHLLLGYDNAFGRHKGNDFERLPELAAEEGFGIGHDTAVTMDGTEVSSTQIRLALAAGNLPLANRMMGAPYSLHGTVVHGRHVGHSLGYPTANIVVDDPHKMLPAAGVYALKTNIEGHSYLAMANLGPQPTFHLERPTLEAHIIGFDGDLYGQPLTVQFLGRQREVRPFDTPEALAAQLEADKQLIINSYTI